MGLAKTPPGDGEPTHLRFASSLLFKTSFNSFGFSRNLKISRSTFLLRIRRLRLEDGGLFLKLKCFRDLVACLTIVVGGMCQQRRMSRGFGHNRKTEGWIFCQGWFRQYLFSPLRRGRNSNSCCGAYYKVSSLDQCFNLSMFQCLKATTLVRWSGTATPCLLHTR